MSAFKSIFVFIFSCCVLSPVHSLEITEDAAKNCFDIIDGANRYVEDLLSALGNDSEAYTLPLGMKKIIGVSSCTLAISEAKFGNQYGELSIFLKIDNIYKSQPLIFGVSGVKISHTGDLIGDVKLSLLSDKPIPLGSLGQVILKGSMDEKTGTFSSGTYLSIDCNGEFKELVLDGELILNENTFSLPGGIAGSVKAPVRTKISDLTDLLLEVSVPSFEINSIPGFEFTLSNVSLDLSDIRNPQVFSVREDYFNNNFSLPDRNLWKGLYADDIIVSFPSMFDKKGTGEKTTIMAHHFLVDENGVTGEFKGTNILPLESGDASGCSFSVVDFALGLEANNIYKFGFGGEINIPVVSTSSPSKYEAYISKEEYLFNVSLGRDIDLNLFGTGELHIQPTSYVQIAVRDGKFLPAVILDGDMELNAAGLYIGQLIFTKLRLSTRNPVLSVESVKYGGNLSLNKFPISISNFSFSSQDNLAALGFDLKVNLMEGAISAGGSVKLKTEYEDDKWRFHGIDIGRIVLDRVQLSGFNLTGEINIVENDPDYGDYFGGQIKATFGALSEALTVDVKSVFGQKEFRYWYVEGQANFSQGVPVGVVTLNGFTGGVYYRMSPSGRSGVKAYAPDKNSSLGVKAGVSFHIASKQAVAGNALLEMNFLSTGGIGSIMFYGDAKFLNPQGLIGDKFMEYYKEAQSRLKDFGTSFADNLPGNLDGSEAAMRILPNIDLSGSITGSLAIKYEFTSRTFDANFKVRVNMGGILRGAGNNNEAGWVHMYCSPQTWYIHAGTPSNPIGLKIGLGSLSLSTESYIMLGDRLERPQLDPNVARILHISPEQTDYMKLPENAVSGKGVAFGSRFKFDTGSLQFLILYARFMAGAGFDVMLSDMSDYRCEGNLSTIGINGWYANGQCYAYLEGELGVRIKILTIKKNITIIKGSTAALLQAKLPNPTWIGGYMAVDLNVLGIIKANMKMKFSFGDECKLVRADGNYSPLDFPVIADINPVDKSKDIDVFLSPQATFNVVPDEAFEAQDDEGNTKYYRAHITDFYVIDNKGKRIEGSIKRNKAAATFEPHEILPPNTDVKLTLSVGFEERNAAGNWTMVSEGGKPAMETKNISFTTGTAPNYIPVSNIEYCYPVIEQKNFFKKESSEGYVQLKKGQSYLFPKGFDYRASFATGETNGRETGFNYIESGKRLTYTFPELNNRIDYNLSFVAYADQKSQSGTPQIKQESVSITDGEEAFTLDYMQQAAQKIIKEGSLKVLDYTFRVGGYNTFSDKVSAMTLTRGVIAVDSDVRLLFLRSGNHELFDEIELSGNSYSGGKPLIQAEALLDDPYYGNDIAPLTYNLLSINGMSIQNRNPDIVGAPPVRGFYVLDNYFTGNTEASRSFPLVYQLVYYYNNDFNELRNKAANLLLSAPDNSLINLIQKQFPFIRDGNYKVRLKYILPGEVQGSTKQINYIY
ncbi:MAG: Ig-like domain-containing protein [Dysgonamonadaceae bacterium]|jgi:hypothetical protein|nr:Ig-like domain-containing protein [Dysgonamonadaceae bacterium]